VYAFSHTTGILANEFAALVADSESETEQRPSHSATSGPSTTNPLVNENIMDKSLRKRTFKGVEIPRTRSDLSSAASVSSLSSMESAGQYDTPATSIAVTPDAASTGKRQNNRKRSRLSEETLDMDEMDIDDATLAAELQQEEYEQDIRPSKKAKTSTKGSRATKFEVEESAEESAGEEVSEEVAEEGSVISYGTKKAKPMKKSGTTRPSRQAGRKARSSIGEVLALRAQRAESEISAFTEMTSGSDFVDDDAESMAEVVSDDDDDEPLALHRRLIPIAESNPDATVTAFKKKRKRGSRPVVDPDDLEEMSILHMDRKERNRKKLEKAHPAIKTMWRDLEAIPVIQPEQAMQPASINRKLKSFQLEGLNWMIKQEKTHYRGGLLGDEMGMGKTIQAVSLIMSDHPAKDPTLVVVPPVALMQWSNEINDYTDGKLNVLVYHNQNSKVKNIKVKELKKYDVIMISYNSLESLYRKETKGWTRKDDIVREASPIHAIHFHRLILDEAHSIKSRQTGVAKACFALKSNYKWCLSGTPVQNRIGEFFSLLRFLEVRPFADYFCKSCDCAMLHWAVDKNHRCVHCKHAIIEHVSVFNQELLNPLTQSEDHEERGKAMDKLHLITARIMLRRMKRDYVSSMELPPKEVIIHNEFFGEAERDFSSSIMTNSGRTFDTYVSRGVMLNNYANIFGLIMQMRQVSNHPDLLLKKHAHAGQNVLVCNICDEPAESPIRSQCKHEFCRECVKSFVMSSDDLGGDPDCPRCHLPLAIDFDQPDIEQDEDAVQKNSIINRISMENWTSSTKIEMLVYDLYKLRSKKQTLKSIIFSQFTSMLQLIEWRLRRAGFNTVMLDGSMTPIQRQRSIDHFMTNPDCEIFLVSLKAGGVALNLTEASRVFIVDP